MNDSGNRIMVTHLVIETQSPMAINTGRREVGFDTELVRDINGLPMIPATAIAGVWSHLVQSTDEALHGDWFGSCDRASALTVSNGYLLDSMGNRVANFTPQTSMEQDPILALCLNERPHHRDQVAINDRGVAKDTGKFDQILLPRGLRFTLTLQWRKQGDQELVDQQWQRLLSLWSHRKFAFGAGTRNGLGRVKIIASEQHCIELEGNKDAGSQLTRARLASVPSEHSLASLMESQGELKHWSIALQALDNWRCGHGTNLLSTTQTDKSVNLITYSEPVVQWNGGKAVVTEPKPVLCGSSIKGILAHRIAFHYRRHTKQWAEEMGQASHSEWEQRPEALKALLGIASDDHAESVAGALWVDDADIEYDPELAVIRHHNSIDRFTGGVRKGALFSEELLYQPRFTINLFLDTSLSELEEPLRQALEDTIMDLEMGLLPMGAGSGRGTSLVIKDKQGGVL